MVLVSSPPSALGVGRKQKEIKNKNGNKNLKKYLKELKIKKLKIQNKTGVEGTFPGASGLRGGRSVENYGI